MNMISKDCLKWGQSSNVIRDISAFGAARKAEIGEDNVFDFSIGNPSVPAPKCVDEAFKCLLETDSVQLHSYTAAPGIPSLRKAVSDYLNAQFGDYTSPELIYITSGASAGLAMCTRGLMSPGCEAVAFAPFFPEYRLFAEAAGAELVIVPPAEGLQPDFAAFEESINEKTALVIVNTPNNPSGVILSAASLARLAAIMKAAEERYGHDIYLVCDEPYRELVYDDTVVPFLPDFYDNTIVCNSFSKSLSLPGERIGYIALGKKLANNKVVFAALSGAARASGYVNAPSLIQRVVERCLGQSADISVYKKNRDLLYKGLRELGFDCVYPDGAFYLFVKAPEADANRFCQRAKAYELLLVPSDDFGVKGYVRLAYCVSAEMIKRSLPAFKMLAEEYSL